MTAQHIAFTVAALLGMVVFWPQLKWIWAWFKPVPIPDPKVAPKDTHSNGSVADAIYVLRSNITTAEGQALVDAVDSWWWKQQVESPKLTATFIPGTPQ